MKLYIILAVAVSGFLFLRLFPAPSLASPKAKDDQWNLKPLYRHHSNPI